MKQPDLTEFRLANLKAARRCLARTRRGTSCQSPTVRGKARCRIHGGLNPGAPKGERNGAYRNGLWTNEAIEERAQVSRLLKAWRDLGRTLGG